MFCKNCGKEITDGVKFCTECGAAVTPPTPMPTPTPVPAPAPVPGDVIRPDSVECPARQAPETAEQPTAQMGANTQTAFSAPVDNSIPTPAAAPISAPTPTEKKKLGKKQICIIAGAVLLLIIIIAAFSGGKVDMKDYIKDDFGFTGFDGYAEVQDKTAAIEWGKLADALFDTRDYKDYVQVNENDSGFDFSFNTQTLASFIDVSFDEEMDGKIGNGDKVKFTITVDYDGINDMVNIKNKLKGKKEYTVSYKAEDLPKATEVDLFDAIECVVYDPNASYQAIKIKYKDGYLKEYDGCTVEAIYSGTTLQIRSNYYGKEVTPYLAPDDFDTYNPPAEITVSLNYDDPAYFSYMGVILKDVSAKVPLVVNAVG